MINLRTCKNGLAIASREVTRLIGIGAICLGATTTHAETPYDGAYSLILENDSFLGSDNNYSNGIGLVWTSSDTTKLDDDRFARKITNVADFLPGVEDAERSYVSISLAQEIHTPDDIENPNPPLDDQPYAGVLFLDTSIHTRNGKRGQAWSLRLGTVGEASQADHTQRWVHRLIDSDEPRGWQSQLPNEFIVNLGYTGGLVWKESQPSHGLAWRVVPITNIELGNYVTAAGAGVYFEIGRNLSPALAISGLGRGFESMFTAGVGPVDQWALSFIVGASGYAVQHYLPLDGTVFRDSRSVDAENVAGALTWGFAARKGRFAASFNSTYLTDTFSSERTGVDFGNLTLSWYF